MNTFVKTNRAFVNGHIRKITLAPVTHFWEELETSRFALIPILLIIIGCMGGIAAGFGAQQSIVQLTVVALSTVLPLALLLAVSPMKLVFYLSVLAVVLDFLVVVF